MVRREYEALSFKWDYALGPGFPFPTGTETTSLVNHEELSSVSHGRGPYSGGDQGGPFYLHKLTQSATTGFMPWAATSYRFNGPFYCGQSLYFGEGTAPLPKSDLALNAMGSTAIARVDPTKSVFSASTFIGEFREDGVPHLVGHELWKERAAHARSAGSEYLNVEFGWKPFLSDIQNFAKAVSHSHDILSGYQKRSSQKIRKRYVFPPETTTEHYEGGGFWPVPANAGSFGVGQSYASSEVKTWFSGAFRYYLPVGDDVASKMSLYKSYADKLLGVSVTPETLWNIAPWSWAADWFSNTGDIIHNVSHLGHDGLAMEYGYLMHSQVYTVNRAALWTVPVPNVASSYSSQEKILVRKAATPYGFGIDMSALTGRQTAILAALGITHLG
jgi:hypothetical protein